MALDEQPHARAMSASGSVTSRAAATAAELCSPDTRSGARPTITTLARPPAGRDDRGAEPARSWLEHQQRGAVRGGPPRAIDRWRCGASSPMDAAMADGTRSGSVTARRDEPGAVGDRSTVPRGLATAASCPCRRGRERQQPGRSSNAWRRPPRPPTNVVSWGGRLLGARSSVLSAGSPDRGLDHEQRSARASRQAVLLSRERRSQRRSRPRRRAWHP